MTETEGFRHPGHSAAAIRDLAGAYRGVGDSRFRGNDELVEGGFFLPSSRTQRSEDPGSSLGLAVALEIPAFAGMTGWGAGMTKCARE